MSSSLHHLFSVLHPVLQRGHPAPPCTACFPWKKYHDPRENSNHNAATYYHQGSVSLLSKCPPQTPYILPVAFWNLLGTESENSNPALPVSQSSDGGREGCLPDLLVGRGPKFLRELTVVGRKKPLAYIRQYVSRGWGRDMQVLM